MGARRMLKKGDRIRVKRTSLMIMAGEYVVVEDMTSPRGDVAFRRPCTWADEADGINEFRGHALREEVVLIKEKGLWKDGINRVPSELLDCERLHEYWENIARMADQLMKLPKTEKQIEFEKKYSVPPLIFAGLNELEQAGDHNRETSIRGAAFFLYWWSKTMKLSPAVKKKIQELAPSRDCLTCDCGCQPVKIPLPECNLYKIMTMEEAAAGGNKKACRKVSRV